jgi:predicted aspartyl protease
MLWVMLAIGSVAGRPVEGQAPSQSATATAVPFDLASDFLVVVEGQAGSLGGLKFIVDTGATRSVIDRKVAVRLELKRHAGRIMNFDRFIPIEWVDVPELQVGPLRAAWIPVMVVNLNQYSEFAKNVDGIMGLDLLSLSDKLTIDYSKKRLQFELAATGTPRPVPGCFVVSIVVQGFAMRLGVDTGLSEILLYGDRPKEHAIKIRTEGETKSVRMGRIKGMKVSLPGVEIGGPEEVITVVLIDGPNERILPGLDGYLGVVALHAKRIEFDFAKMVLRWH